MSPCFFLVRHAQSANNAQHEQFRMPDPPITSLGESQSHRLALAMESYGLTRLLVSPFLRAIQTVRGVAERTGIQPHIHSEIFEQGGCYRGHLPGDRHPMPGMGNEELKRLCPGWTLDPRIAADGWNSLDHYETIEEARQRAQRVADWLATEARTSGVRMALIIHADFKMRLLEAMLDRDDLESHFGDVVNTSISRLSRAGNRWRLDYWNAHQHLEPEWVTT